MVAAFPTGPLAATASVFTFDEGARILSYAADVGEINQVEASVTEDQAVTIHDSGAVITAEAGCLSVDAHTVECPSIVGAILALGDLDDAVSVPESFAVFRVSVDVRGGPGADTLSSCAACLGLLNGQRGDDNLTGRVLGGGLGNDALSGGDRNDDLVGGPGNDTITAGGGSDNIRPGSGDDAVDAGAGNHDLLAYFDEPGPMTVNLRTGVATGAGADTFVGVESVFGSHAKRGDLLIGDEHANTFNGGMGPDVIRGGRGADRLNGGDPVNILGRRSADTLYGGPGDDLLEGGNGNDILGGGPGMDSLFGGRGDDLLSSRDGERDIVSGQRGFDRARVDRRLDDVRGVEKLI